MVASDWISSRQSSFTSHLIRLYVLEPSPETSRYKILRMSVEVIQRKLRKNLSDWRDKKKFVRISKFGKKQIFEKIKLNVIKSFDHIMGSSARGLRFHLTLWPTAIGDESAWGLKRLIEPQEIRNNTWPTYGTQSKNWINCIMISNRLFEKIQIFTDN